MNEILAPMNSGFFFLPTVSLKFCSMPEFLILNEYTKMWLNFLLWLLSSVTGFEHFVGLQIATYLVVCLVGMNSEMTPEGQRITKLEQILLNGNNIAIVSVWSFS
jgi:hypothetical protein